MSVVIVKRNGWSLTRNGEGQREYTVKHQVLTNDTDDGPSVVMNAGGLPAIGTAWNFGNDLDSWAFCLPNMSVQPIIKKERNLYWDVSQTFSTAPMRRCQDETIEDPLQEPDRISGDFVKYVGRAHKDKDGNLIAMSNNQPILGPDSEWDFSRPTVTIEQNVASLGLSSFSGMVDTVNDSALWGLAARKVKLSSVSWERALFGTCSFYYIRRFGFDVNFNTFDRVVLDEGDIVLSGYHNDGVWTLRDVAGAPPVATQLMHFVKYHDRNGDSVKTALDGAGKPLALTSGYQFQTIQYYPESNFLTLGIPTTL